MMPATFVLQKGSTGKFRFNLVASNGQVVATSEAYNTKAAAMAGIASVRKNASGAGMDDRTKAAPAKASAPAKKAAARKPAAKRAGAAKATTAVRKAPAKARKG
jgi:uncharacterized protein YegP (UPF0339 family)